MSTWMMAEFPTADAMLAALRVLPGTVLSGVETYAPFDVPGVDALLRRGRSRMGWSVAAGVAAGILGGYVIQWWTSVRAYPLNTGGRPLNAVPSFMPITFESAVLAAAAFGCIAFLVVLRLPCLWAPEDEIPGFERATVDRFWIRVRMGETKPDRAAVLELLKSHGALRVVPKPAEFDA